jgi:hypothetical protein
MEYLVIAFWIGMSVVNGLVAQQKKRNVTAAVLTSVFLTPVFSYLYLLAVPAVTPPSGVPVTPRSGDAAGRP